MRISNRKTAVKWARVTLGSVWGAALVVAILAAFGVDVETAGWNVARIVAFVLSVSAVLFMGFDWMQSKRERNDGGLPPV